MAEHLQLGTKALILFPQVRNATNVYFGEIAYLHGRQSYRIKLDAVFGPEVTAGDDAFIGMVYPLAFSRRTIITNKDVSKLSKSQLKGIFNLILG